MLKEIFRIANHIAKERQDITGSNSSTDLTGNLVVSGGSTV